MKRKPSRNITACSVIRKHFGRISTESLITASRTFPPTSRVDLQMALTQMFEKRYAGKLIGIHPQYSHETLTFSHLLREGQMPVLVGPLQQDEIDIGETLPTRCVKHGLWLSQAGETRFAFLLTPAEKFGHSEGVHVEIAVPPGEAGFELSRG